jgi:hypothetical protein
MHFGAGAWNTHPGKLCKYSNRWSCFIGNGGREERYETYKALVGNPLEFGWTSMTSSGTPPSNALRGGWVVDSGDCYVCRAWHYGGGAWNLHPGKLCKYSNRWSCFIGNGGVEQRYEQYDVMTRLPLPDLWATESVTPATFRAWQPVTYSVSVHNLGAGVANNFNVEMHTSLPAAIDQWNTGDFACNALQGGPSQALFLSCKGSLPAYTSATMTFTLKTSSNFLPSGTPFTLYGYLDQPNVIPESNEQNNLFTKAAIVQ